MPVEALAQELRSLSDPRFERHLASGQARSLRVTEARDPLGRKSVTLSLLGPNGAVLTTAGFFYGPRKPPPGKVTNPEAPPGQ